MTPPKTNVDANLIEQLRKRINQFIEEMARLSESEVEPGVYYAELLQRSLAAIAAPAGAVWLRTTQGNLQLLYQINVKDVGLDRTEAGRHSHDELLRQAVIKARPGLIPPHSGLAPQQNGAPAAGNPTDFVILLAPIIVDKQVAGVIEIWQDPARDPDAQRGFQQLLAQIAALASVYVRNQQRRLMTDQQEVWSQLEAFARAVHASLNPTEVAYHVANEGRRLMECDRVSVAIRLGKRVRVESISGADVIEKRSNLVQRMRTLLEHVLVWGERLVYTGVKDDALPPLVLTALDAYLSESNSKLLVVQPLRDEREKDSKRPARSVVMIESFEPQTAPEQMLARLEVLGKHAAPALYNAVEHRRIPMRMLWVPMAYVQEGLGGKARAILYGVTLLLAALVTALVIVPYPLKMDANGQLQPQTRNTLYTPYAGQVIAFAPGVRPSGPVAQNEEVVLMRSLELGGKIRELQVAVATAQHEINNLTNSLQALEKEEGKGQLRSDLLRAQAAYHGKSLKLEELRSRTNANLQNPGDFWLKSPIKGIVLSSDFREVLTNRTVKENEPILRIGYVNPEKKNTGEWEVELKIPQKHIGQVLSAFAGDDPQAELDVDILLVSKPTQTYKGKLARAKVASEANLDKNQHDETEPVVLAWVRLTGAGIPTESQLPPELLLTGTEVHARVRCGNRPMGYSLFYGVWEFLYEKVVFFF